MEKQKFRPSANIISTIGQDIIKDVNAAIVELVKNAYDADSEYCKIEFKEIIESENDENQKGKQKNEESTTKLEIYIIDGGHGMTSSDVTEKWLVPSTDNKLVRKKSPKGRMMQGRKGIGRFAAAILGEKLEMSTVNDFKETKLIIDWNQFNNLKYLDEVEFDIDTQNTTSKNGTTIKITASKNQKDIWNQKQFDQLIKELRKLLTPFKNNDTFDIFLKIETSIPNYTKYDEKITPFELLNYYNYRLAGKVFDNNGKANLVFYNSDSNTEEEINNINIDFKGNEKFISKIDIDLRVFDRDPEAIEEIIKKLKDTPNKTAPKVESLNKNETKLLLNEICGVYIYRNGFRIRPYGDSNYDWLSLDSKRVQSPSIKIGMNQIAGYITINSEEESGLYEKSARDGLKEDEYYFGLISVMEALLSEIENRRSSYRLKVRKGRPKSLDNYFQTLVDYNSLKKNVINIIKEENLENDKIKKIETIIDEDILEKTKIANDIENEIAIYQGQATLGKMIDLIMHESRKPIGWLKNQNKRLAKLMNNYKIKADLDLLNKMLKIIDEAVPIVQQLTNLYNRINPLATKSRSTIEDFSLNEVVNISLNAFTSEIDSQKIKIEYEGTENIMFTGWKSDFFTALTNIFENAIFWLHFKKDLEKRIVINFNRDENEIRISIWNNGPSIPDHMIDNGLLFEPRISGKPGGGTGIGLPIAGEAINRNSGYLEVEKVTEGAKFVIVLPNGGIKSEG